MKPPPGYIFLGTQQIQLKSVAGGNELFRFCVYQRQ
jgi:hypothetical protein